MKREFTEEQKAAKAIYLKKWREDNKEAVKANMKKYSEENKETIAAYKKKYREDNKEYVAASMKKWHEENKDHRRNAKLKKSYGIDSNVYDEMLDKQGGVCFLCSEVCKSGMRLAVDHCHTTGKVRALLCGECNTGLGKFKENVALMEKAIEYLKFHKEG